jgi:hypothetical protein
MRRPFFFFELEEVKSLSVLFWNEGITATRECIQRFPDWPPRARTVNGTALCHKMQLCRYFLSQSSEFCCHNPLCCFSTSVYCCKRTLRYRLSPETFGYTLVCGNQCSQAEYSCPQDSNWPPQRLVLAFAWWSIWQATGFSLPTVNNTCLL